VSPVHRLRSELGLSPGVRPKHAEPIKEGATFETYVLVPWLPGSADHGVDAARRLLEAVNYLVLSVAIKKQITQRFFDAVIADARRVANLVSSLRLPGPA